MKPDRKTGDGIVDDVEMEAFIEWLYQHGHTPFTMSRNELMEVWLRGLKAFHTKRWMIESLKANQYAFHVEAARHASEMLSTLKQ